MSPSLVRSPHSCPRCLTPMLVGEAGGMSVHGCPSCGGVWLGTECARRFSMELPPDAIELAAKHSALALDSAKTLPLIDCPVCGMRMQRTHAAAAMLDLDYCDNHGTWYDRNELGAIARVLSRSQWNRSEPQGDASALAQATSPGRRDNNNDNDDVIDMAAMGLSAAIDVADTAIDTAVIAGDGADFVGGILGFFTDIFD